jgi:hypothetical protein
MAESPEWRPWSTDWEQSGRIFLDEQELEMMKFIHENFITMTRFFGGSDFKLLTA